MSLTFFARGATIEKSLAIVCQGADNSRFLNKICTRKAMPFLPSRMIGGSITCEIDASPEIVWDVICDTANATSILSQLIEQQVVKSCSDGGVGTVVRQVREWNGKQTESFRTITGITTKPQYSISTNIYLNRSSALSDKSSHQDVAARTGSWTIVEGETPNSSVFVWTYSAIPESLGESLIVMLFKRKILKIISKHFEQDLHDFAVEAERRQRLLNEANAMQGNDSTDDDGMKQ